MPGKSSKRAKQPTASRARETRGADLQPAGVVQDVVVRAMRLGDALASHMDRFFRQYGLTTLQYNVMRILYVRDPEGAGLPSGSFAARLVRRVPDVPRLIDRLVKAGLLERVRSDEDRRVVRVRLTRKGTALVERINDPLFEHDRSLLAGLSEAELARLARQLDRALHGVLENGRALEEDAD